MDNPSPLPSKLNDLTTATPIVNQQQTFTQSSVVVGHFNKTVFKKSYASKWHRFTLKNTIIIIAMFMLVGVVTYGLSGVKHKAENPKVAVPNIQQKKPLPAGSPVSASTPKPQNPPASKPTNSNTVTKSSSYSAPVPTACAVGTYQPAGALSISAGGPGLQQQIDVPTYYQVYGYTAAQIRTELNQCTPVRSSTGDFDAETTWFINYAYNYSPTSKGTCVMSQVAVGEHISFVYPKWANSSYASTGLDSQWQAFMTHLTTHENGHKDIVLQYANSLFSGLQNFTQNNCSTMAQSANSWADGQITALNQASVNYDAQTGHGASQGATFP